jgi:hypothetical protein
MSLYALPHRLASGAIDEFLNNPGGLIEAS